MSHYRAKIGYVTPAGDTGGGAELQAILPHGVHVVHTTLAVSKLVHEDAVKAFRLYPPAIEHLVTQECDLVSVGGSLVFSHMGLDLARDMIQEIRGRTQIPIIIDLEAHLEALRALSAQKIVIATPYTEGRTEERRQLCEKMGFHVLSTTSLGLEARIEIQELSPWVAYRMAKQAYLQAPEAEAIYLSCPEWPHVDIIELLEQDTGKPVVYPYGALVWKWCQVLHIKEPITGYGKLLELI